MAQEVEVNNESRITSDQSKDALYKAHSIQASASEIDSSYDFYKNNFAGDNLNVFNGSSSVATLDADYTLNIEGDYIEFQAIFLNYNMSTFGTLDDYRYHMGFYTSTMFRIRGNTATLYDFDCEVNQGILNTYKLLRTATGYELFINDVSQGTVTTDVPIKINHIGNAYSSNYFHGFIGYIKFNISSVETTFTNITTELTNTDVTFENITNYDIAPATDVLRIKYDGDKSIIITKGFRNGFIAYEYTRQTVANDKDNWTINQVFESSMFNNLGEPISSTGEWENAIAIQGADDFMGGHYHGDEILTSFKCTIDGIVNPLTSEFEVMADKIEFLQTSNLNAPSGLVNEGDTVATSKKHWTFNATSRNTIENEITWITSETITNGYMFMSPIYRTTITDSGTIGDGYDLIDLSAGGYTGDAGTFKVGTDFTGGVVRLWGDKFSLIVDEVTGFDSDSKVFFEDTNDRNKLYFAKKYNNYVTSIDETWNLSVKFDVTVR
jgi:hypothetical protein